MIIFFLVGKPALKSESLSGSLRSMGLKRMSDVSERVLSMSHSLSSCVNIYVREGLFVTKVPCWSIENRSVGVVLNHMLPTVGVCSPEHYQLRPCVQSSSDGPR